ncbi:hypothetical protein KUH03_29445 [Sphingobacterium sp. E70]|uniref:hypothetical protein n=1 Tax=Sphingobacterium sp. E70 TaxID=2853439 RepID=UPI00211D04E5|nr:hypothetical protein [Sphingobacterium sp. E70]ULT23303.1 hypothetical protein KUH03_29445 [Sphingobacterium sp. E70]
MTTANNVQAIAEKVKSFAMGFIGAFFWFLESVILMSNHRIESQEYYFLFMNF